MNQAQLDARKAQLQDRLEKFTKSYANDATKDRQFRQLKDEFEEWSREQERFDAIQKATAKMNNWGDASTAPSTVTPRAVDEVSGLTYEELARVTPNLDGTIIKTRGWQIDPADRTSNRDAAHAVAEEIKSSVEEKRQFKAVKYAETKSFTSASSLVPADLSLPIQERIFDVDVMGYLPTITGGGSTFRIVTDTSITSSYTPTAALTAEGAAKAQNPVAYTDVDFHYGKLAEYITLSRETLADYPTSLNVTIQKAMNDVVMERNIQLLSGTSTIPGLIPNAGNTIAVPTSLATGVTQLDYFVQAAETVRSAPGVFAEPNLCILHPTTWYSLQLIKDSLGRPLLNPSQGIAATHQIAGVPVKLSTDIAAGTALLLNTDRYGYVVVRESIVTLQGYNAEDFISNLQSWVVESRLTQVIVRPTAIVTITGLESTFTI
jgi:HK97 family phage major capsid protein